ncbi:acyl-CoA dehydrogenase family protein [Haloarchaeobius sp. TZWSO28]|uniref:acyl-CoA dehydrogenase family protein n=1 Tax=Haloarchaeobius sp. TZWSO28 TaxID=3446119 RepID=UPI003EBE8FA1
MNFEETPEHELIRKTASEIASDYGPEYWREHEEAQKFPHDYWDELTEAGFHGLLIPEEYGGAGMGMQEMAIAMQTLCEEGCGLAGAWFMVVNATMCPLEISKYGTDAQKEKYLRGIANGERTFAIGITEPDSGSNTLNTTTHAVKDGDEYVINGQKVWTSMADLADHVILVTRTTPADEVEHKNDGISLFIADLDDPAIDVSPIPKHALNYTRSCEVFIDDLRVPEENLLGEKGNGWKQLTQSLNPERIAFAAGATGTARLAAKHAVEYSNEREVFDGPIGQYQGIQFPIAEHYAQVETASAMMEKAAWKYDNGEPSGYDSNIAKAAAIEAAIPTIYHSMQTFGGWGYAKEYHVERWWREINLTRLAPVTQQMAYNFIAQHLGFPRSY